MTANVLKPDIILLTETWLNDSFNNVALSLTGYILQSDLRLDKSTSASGIGGGLVVYTKSGLEVCKTNRFEQYGFTQFTEFEVGRKLNIVLVYRSPNSSLDNTEELSRMVQDMEVNTLFIGDFNLPGIDWEAGTAYARGRGLLEAAAEAGAEQMVTFPTHVKGNVLDLVITNCPGSILSISDAGRLGKSDHCCLLIETTVRFGKNISKTTRQDWRKADTVALKNYLKETDWETLLGQLNTEEAWAKFKEVVTEAVNKYVPLSTCRAAGTPPWLNREIVKLVRRKKKAWKILKQYSTVEARDNYARLERETTKKIQNAKRRLEREVARTRDDNGKKFSRYVRSKTKTRDGVGPLKSENGSLIVGEAETANMLNDFFASVFTEEDTTRMPHLGLETEEELLDIQIKKEEIVKCILNLKMDSAAGPDGIQARLLKAAEKEVAVPLEIIFRKSLGSATIPSD